MSKTKRTYNLFQLASAVFMIVALLWLTISAPFVYAGQQLQAKFNTTQSDLPIGAAEEEAANPFGNTTEEKAPSTNSFQEEYLHDQHRSEIFFSIASQYHKLENAGTYIAFHGEMLVPPPNVA